MTDIELRELVKVQLDSFGKELHSIRELFDVRLMDMEKALILSEKTLDKKFDSINEIRQMAFDQANRFIPRSEYDVKHESLEENIKDLQLTRASLEGKASQKSVSFVLSIAIIGLILSSIQILLDFMKH